jgi:hypothetical protein
MARSSLACFIDKLFFKYFFKDVLTLLLQKVNLRSKGYATQRLLRIRIGYPTYPQSKTD